jgi:phthalate 4,5-cis-dihydrodiol dehydrogenase
MTEPGSDVEKQRDALRFGVLGMGVGASQVVVPLSRSPYSVLAAGADINPRVRKRFSEVFPSARLYDNVEALCRDPDLDAIWISTPNKFHADHAVLAADSGKHVIVSKPMTTSVADAERMIAAAERNKVKLLAGHSLGFSPAVRMMARLGQPDGRLGQVKAVQTMSFTDWMLLPRTAEEVDAAQGGGLIHRQSPHLIDTLRVLCGGMVHSVRGTVGDWMRERKAPGFFTAFLNFENGAVGTASHNGYGYFVSSEVVPWGSDAGISGNDSAKRAAARRAIREGTLDEEALKDAMRLGGGAPLFRESKQPKPWVPLHTGILVVTCERGDMRHAPFGIYVYDDEGKSELPIADDGSWMGMGEIEEMYRSVKNGAELYRDGRWGLATLEVAMAIIESSRTQKEVKLQHQVPVRPGMLA